MNRYNDVGPLGVCVLVTLLGLGRTTAAQEAEQAEPKIDPKAEKVIKALVDHMGQVRSLSVDIHEVVTNTVSGADRTVKNLLMLAQERPNKVSLIGKENVTGGVVVSDGQQLYAYGPSRRAPKTYTAAPAPEDLWGVWQHRSSRLARMTFGGPGFTLMAKVFAGLGYEDVVRDVARVGYAGLVDLDGSACHRLEIEAWGTTWDLWVSDGPKPLAKKSVLELRGTPGARTKGMPSAGKDKTLVTTTYKNWAIDPKLPPETFTFIPPPGAKKVSADQPKPRPGEETHPLVGKPAPEFEIPLLEGGTLKLSEQKGKTVVVLDFWATWCPPCRKALPILIEVTGAYKKKGVRFCAVDLREDAEKIKGWLSKQGLSCSVGLDKDGRVAQQYAVTGIPQSVIIGKDGTVQAVHVGFAPDLKTRLTKELDTLLAGKSLIGHEGDSH